MTPFKSICTFCAIPVILFGQVNLPAPAAAGNSLMAYRALFRQIQWFDQRAQTAPAVKATELLAWHERKIGLSTQEFAQLKKTALAHVVVVDGIENHAQQIINAARANMAGQALASRSALPPVPAELHDLQRQRDDMTSASINQLRTYLGPTSFAKLDAWVKSNFNQQLTKSSVSRPMPIMPAKGAAN